MTTTYSQRHALRLVTAAEKRCTTASDNLAAHAEVARRVRSALDGLLGPAFGPEAVGLPADVRLQRDVANHALVRIEEDEAEMERELDDALGELAAAKANLVAVTPGASRTYADYPRSKGGRRA